MNKKKKEFPMHQIGIIILMSLGGLLLIGQTFNTWL